MRGILGRDRTDLHAQTTAGLDVPHNRLGADLSFLNKKMEAHQFAFLLARARLKEETGGAKIANAGNVSIGRRFPVNPQIMAQQDARRSSAGGAGCDMHRTHRFHPRPQNWLSRGLTNGQLRTGCKFWQRDERKSTENYRWMRKLASRYWYPKKRCKIACFRGFFASGFGSLMVIEKFISAIVP
jgi:hypothetical protein